MGGAAVIWLLLWAFLIGDTPETQSFISQEERDMIVESLRQGSDDKESETQKVN